MKSLWCVCSRPIRICSFKRSCRISESSWSTQSPACCVGFNPANNELGTQGTCHGQKILVRILCWASKYHQQLKENITKLAFQDSDIEQLDTALEIYRTHHRQTTPSTMFRRCIARGTNVLMNVWMNVRVDSAHMCLFIVTRSGWHAYSVGARFPAAHECFWGSQPSGVSWYFSYPCAHASARPLPVGRNAIFTASRAKFHDFTRELWKSAHRI